MADYKNALEAGFAAAKKAEVARNEVKDTLEKFKADLLAATDGKLLVEIREYLESDADPFKYVPGANMAQMFAKSLQKKKTYSALVAKNPKVDESRFKILARWKQATDGYPCSLIWGKQELQCEDRAALEEGLAELLKDPIVGEMLFSLTQLA